MSPIRRAWLVAITLAVGVTACHLVVISPETLVHDWHGWRQADTQSIARIFHREGIDLLRPRIAWGGDGSGIVEAELPLFPAVVAVIMKVTGEVEWAGRAVSALAIALTGLLIFAWLAPRRGPAAALAAQALFLGSQGAVFLVSVQPDALGLCFVVASLVATALWVESDHPGHAAASSALLIVGALLKPTLLAISAARGILVAWSAPGRLTRLLPWALGTLELGAVAAWLAWGAHLHATHGNTFGVISGGDSKFPTLDRLLSPMQYVRLVEVGLTYGPGLLGAVALAVAAFRRTLDAATAGLWVAYAATGVIAMRYMTESWLGSHYHALGIVAGAAALAAALEGVRASRVLWLAPALLAPWLVALQSRPVAAAGWASAEIEAAQQLRTVRPPNDGTLVIVRSRVESRVDHWGGINHFEDPRVFYLADATGWVVPSDRWDATELEDFRRRGARWYVAPGGPPAPPVDGWLAQTAERRYPLPSGGVVVALRPPP